MKPQNQSKFYLRLIEKGFSGKEVQLFHMKMTKRKVEWPVITLPQNRGDITVEDVLNATSDTEKDQKILQWYEAVWEAFVDNRQVIANLVNHYDK
ncbi:DUF5946 family protein [uncultured Kordia sp.]|uniref:DUF5946 family protein n=1 Tax=uncultured Kordia sp. TaxID=507699 RepID=UPI00261CE4FF|nr:DUF5946 family protein [uncultured Kordia sp.]